MEESIIQAEERIRKARITGTGRTLAEHQIQAIKERWQKNT